MGRTGEREIESQKSGAGIGVFNKKDEVRTKWGGWQRRGSKWNENVNLLKVYT